MNVLLICTGNSCRSVIAHYLLEHMARERGLPWKIQSCGIAAQSSFPIPAAVHKALAQRGVRDVRHTPQPLTRELLEWADVALTMTRMHRDFARDLFPEFRSKIHLLIEYASGVESDVEDPIGQPDEAYFRCREVLEKALAATLEKHAAKKN